MAATYPVHVDATLDPGLTRWMWLVKWLLAIPHYLVLALLWLAFVVLSIVAFFAILFTGRYPRAIFDFNVGVLRWSWRVTYYAYGALGTDRYPPFSLYDVPDYPAHLEVEYPQHLSRGLVLVKWWLLALPHYLIVAFFAGGGWYVADQATTNNANQWIWSYGGGLIGLMVLIAAVVLLFTGRYPQQIFDFVLGMNRWVLRVAAYASLMTDEYPPFRFDMGGPDPDGGRVAVPQRPSPESPASAVPPGSAAPPAPSGPPGAVPPTSSAPPATARAEAPRVQPWTAGRVVAMVFAVLTFLVAGGLLAGGTTLLVADNTLRDNQGFFMSSTQRFAAGGYAIESEALRMGANSGPDYVPRGLLGDAKLEVTPATGGRVFVGVAPTSEVDTYLAGVQHSTVVGFDDRSGTAVPQYVETPGKAPATRPGASDIWTAQAVGRDTVTLTWPMTSGTWSVVVMNADGSPNVAADVAAGATFPAVGGVVTGLMVAGVLLLLLSGFLLYLALRRPRSPYPPGDTGASTEVRTT